MSSLIKFRQAIAATNDTPFYWHYWGYLKSDSTGIPMFTGPIGIMSRDKRQSYQFVCLDKHGEEVYAGDKFAFYHPNVVSEFAIAVWDKNKLQWWAKTRRGSLLPLYNLRDIELIKD
jgi:hypothetical protein